MENTQRILILYAIMLSLNCLNAEEGETAAKRTVVYKCCWTNPRYVFWKYLGFKTEVKRFVTLEKRFCFWFHRKLETVNSFWVKKNQVWSRKTTWEISGRNRWSRCLRSTSRMDSRLLPEMIKTHRILQSGLDYNSKFSLGPHKIISAPNQQEVAWNTTPTFPKMDYGYFPLFSFF